ncbi:lysophospholipid acyltransferase family protein [Xylophilus sp. GOD-11R]|uniref:lysophospholipid acyltransferase family protein n=1 Tax=Xylophilus sp. GOD-11R TaxID=3089814 RepID=UPI00298BD3E6|nr:lysophospholipid acyltransferase family protein [Xylophilus sp. GOD-11R]WPB56485.1 lysophospholipid acyltransferase family protein [Xylophilus sp. GOD-11R]
MNHRFTRWAAGLLRDTLLLVVRLLTRVTATRPPGEPRADQTLYFANHTSHGDFMLLWATLPPALRRRTRPVAGRDYWLASPLRRFVGEKVFCAVMIRRDASQPGPSPVDMIVQALSEGSSLIFFPEGTRNVGEEVLQPFRSGLFHVAAACPQVRLVPAWIDGIREVLPKGAVVPVPHRCQVFYGEPIALMPGEEKEAFIARSRQALLALKPATAPAT